MLVIKSVEDLKVYLQMRLQMAKGQKTHDSSKNRTHGISHAEGMIYAFTESIRAVEAVIASENAAESVQAK